MVDRDRVLPRRARPRAVRLTILAPVVVALAAGAAAAAGAQDASVLIGSVSSKATHMPVVGAEVSIPSLARSVVVTGTGDFRLRELPAGAVDVVIRGVGFKPLLLKLTFSGRDTVVRDVELDALAPGEGVTELPVVPVTARAEPAIRRGKLADFDRRRHAAVGGRFLTRDALEKLEGQTLAEAVRKLPGAQLLRLGNGGWAVAEGRGLASISGNHYGGDTRRGDKRACYARILLDGVQIYQSSAGVSPPDLRTFAVNQIEAVEYYAGAASVPVEFNATGSGCGVLAIWTRER